MNTPITINQSILDPEAIIGIGPLMHRSAKDPISAQLDNMQQAFFIVHCRARDIEVATDFLPLGYTDNGLSGENEQARGKFKSFTKQYDQARELVTQIITERLNPASTVTCQQLSSRPGLDILSW